VDLERISQERMRQNSFAQSVMREGQPAEAFRTVRFELDMWRDGDVLLTPGLAARPPAIGEINGLGERPMEDLERSGRWTPFLWLFNVTGQPAMTLPVGIGGDGLPTGVQIVGKPLCEDTLLQVAAQVELAHPWAHHRPEPVVQA